MLHKLKAFHEFADTDCQQIAQKGIVGRDKTTVV